VLSRARAELVGGDGRRHAVSPSSATVIGRLPDCDVTLDDAAVSRRHARLVTDGVNYEVEDLNSTNGVRLNGQAVTRAALHDGDQLDFGGVRFTFTLGR
jgi:pSer/pThr/pTyr-binding forkhead associated (FHA) protein